MEPSNYPQEQSKPSYEYLITYKQSVEIERLTDKFCQVYLDPFKDRRYIEQMNSSARSMPRNIVEGYTRLGLKDYIEFLSFARASGEELLKKVYSGRRLYGKSCFKKKKTSRFLGNEFKIIFPSKYLFFYKSGYRNILIQTLRIPHGLP